MLKQFVALSLLCLPALVGCSKDAAPVPANVPVQRVDRMKVASAAFQDARPIPRHYTCDGINISPPLEWSGVPKQAKTIAVIMDDPDAPGGTWVHWVLYNLPAENIGLIENQPATENLKAGGFQGQNDFHKLGYAGPCPPSGMHGYMFKVYALDAELSLKAGATKAELETAMQGHIIAQAELMGTYQRSR